MQNFIHNDKINLNKFYSFWFLIIKYEAMFNINPIDKKNPEIKLVLFELGYSISKKIETVINKRLEMYIKFFMVIFVKF